MVVYYVGSMLPLISKHNWKRVEEPIVAAASSLTL